jgi:hypothetical protein
VKHLYLVSGGADRELDAIRNAMGTFQDVSDLDQVIAVLRGCAAAGCHIDVLDAVGHSRSPGFLVLGTWVIDDSPQTAATFAELLRPWLQQLGVRTIRLLGCSTATTERGRNALRRIAVVTGCCVLGTKRYISHHDYGAAGFASADTLIDSHGHRREIESESATWP